MIEMIKCDNVAIITMDDGKVNAASKAMLGFLNERLDEAERDCGAIVLAGRKGVFSAGFDLKTMQGGDKAERAAMTRVGSETISRLFHSPVPVVAAVTGHAFALGAVMACACDHAVGERGEYSYAVNETKIGEIFPPWGYEVLRCKLAPRYVHQAAVLSRVLGVEEALEANFINEAVDEGTSIDRAVSLATEWAKLPREAYWANKASIRGAAMDRVKESVGEF